MCARTLAAASSISGKGNCDAASGGFCPCPPLLFSTSLASRRAHCQSPECDRLRIAYRRHSTQLAFSPCSSISLKYCTDLWRSKKDQTVSDGVHSTGIEEEVTKRRSILGGHSPHDGRLWYRLVVSCDTIPPSDWSRCHPSLGTRHHPVICPQHPTSPPVKDVGQQHHHHHSMSANRLSTYDIYASLKIMIWLS